jgi:MraZ protein
LFFLGTFDYAMDERGRVPIPPRYREAFQGGIVLNQGSPNKCLRIFTPAAFEEHARHYTAASPMRRRGQDLRKVLFARSLEVQPDPQNRLLIPGFMREYAGLDGKVRMIGHGEWIELWSVATLEAEMERIDQTLEATLESTEDWER